MPMCALRNASIGMGGARGPRTTDPVNLVLETHLLEWAGHGDPALQIQLIWY